MLVLGIGPEGPRPNAQRLTEGGRMRILGGGTEAQYVSVAAEVL